MRTIRYGTRDWDQYLAALPRAASSRPEVDRTVAGILQEVQADGDRALIRFTAKFDRVKLTTSTIKMRPADVRASAKKARPDVVQALQRMARQIEAYHKQQLDSGFRLKFADGSVLEEVVRPLESVGLYVPGGSGAYPSSVLMSAIPARVAGVSRIVVVTPPRSLEENPAVAAALVLVGLEDSVYAVGGAQAIAALAYGTQTVPAVSKIVGPGNAFVASAKRQVRGRVEIDHEAGPSEVVILADSKANPAWVAADLLAQAEHGSGDETIVLVTPHERLAADVAVRVAAGVKDVANPEAASRALRHNGACVIVHNLTEGVTAVNTLAPEHVQVMTLNAPAVARRITGGAVFVGAYAPVALGDYGIGPNHVLPTGGAARFSSPLSVREFVRRQTQVTVTERGLRRVAQSVISVARAEGFPGHAQSVVLRVGDGRKRK
jgi:histidinol dehydrogenase